jgi:hypothetical protein
LALTSAGVAAQTVNNIPKNTAMGTFTCSAITEVNGNGGNGTTDLRIFNFSKRT